MEYTMSLNEILRDDITKLNYTLHPPGFHGDVRAVRVMQEILSHVIDELGSASAAAQGLNRVITSADRLRAAPDHTLYLLKDADGKGGRGQAVGMLKVGRKHLYLFDDHHQVREVEPLCVLDFYVVRDRQRRGLGRRLFDHMLQDQGARAEQMPIDGPSAKMEQFLQKNYGLDRLLKQSNNFAISPHFFSATEHIRAPPPEKVSTPAVGRFTAPKPPSAIATVIHGGGSYYTSNGKASARESPEPQASEPEPEPEPEPQLEAEPEPEPEDTPPAPAERPQSLAVPAGGDTARKLSPAGAGLSRRDSQLTERGYFDVKFYHNKLW